ncbi:MAG TPA: hypothetical protein PK926_03405 [Spirochaetota bacterium]|nr:hypothetical protein [Spirochaetota bacterium]HPI88785.1 hypothetical protein [Spirochaetota bacterium]HPR47141.1 hypothetical protein [Spirochaetota bacterium]
MKEKKNPYETLKRPTVPLTGEEHKAIAHFCIDHDISIGALLKKDRAVRYKEKHTIARTKTT